MKHTCALLVVAAALVGLGSPGNFAAAQDGAARPARPAAQNRPAKPTAPNVVEVPGRNEVNEWTISLAGGLLEGTFIRYAADIAKVLDDGNNLRVIPLVTYGAVGNVTDLLHLRGVDIAITQADVLEHFRRELQISNIQDRIHFISPLFHSEVHIYTREEFKTIKDLTGRKVAFNTRGSAANYTGNIVFDRLGVKVEKVFMNNSLALEAMRKGELAGIVHVVGKPNDLFAKFKPEPGFHFLPIEDDSKFTDYYVPARLTAEDYPNLIPAGTTVPTIAVQTVLAVFNWPVGSDRYRRVVRFIDAYFEKFSQLQQPPFQPKWQEVNAAGTVPGWTRFAAAEEWLKRNREQQRQPRVAQQEQFNQFLAAKTGGGQAAVTPRQREQLFEEFLKWSQARDRR